MLVTSWSAEARTGSSGARLPESTSCRQQSTPRRRWRACVGLISRTQQFPWPS